MFVRALVAAAVVAVGLLVLMALAVVLLYLSAWEWVRREVGGDNTSIGHPDVPLDSWPSWTPAEVLEQEGDQPVASYGTNDGRCDHCGKRSGDRLWVCDRCDLSLCERCTPCRECDVDASGVATRTTAMKKR